MGRIGSVDKLEEFDEFAAAVAIPDEGANLTREQINAGQQTDRTVALVFVVARKGRVHAGLGRQVRCRRGERLNTGLLVIGHDRHGIARLLAGAYGAIAALDDLPRPGREPTITAEAKGGESRLPQ